MAEVTLAWLDGRARAAEAVFGWGRSTVELGLKELQAGIVCRHDLSRQRKPKTEAKHPQLLADIRAILDPKSQAQSHRRTTLSYTNVTAQSVRAALLESGCACGRAAERADLLEGIEPPGLSAPARGKSPGPKKTAWTDAIFANAHRANQAADADPHSVRISMDTKTVSHLGPYARGELARGRRPGAAADHDLLAKAKLVPGGILEMNTGRPFLFFTESAQTSDFLVDGLELLVDGEPAAPGGRQAVGGEPG